MSLSSPASAARFPTRVTLAAVAALAFGATPALADDAPPTAAAPVVAPEPALVVAPVAEPAPQAPLAAFSADVFAPQLEIGDVRRQLEVARKTGLRVTYTASEPVTLQADVQIFGDVADRELRMSALPGAGPGDSLAKATIVGVPTGTNAVRVPFNLAARRTLRKFFKITVRVRLIATDAAGNATTSYKRVSLTLD